MSYADDMGFYAYEIKKVKNKNATVIEIEGQRYILDYKDRFRGGSKHGQKG